MGIIEVNITSRLICLKTISGSLSFLLRFSQNLRAQVNIPFVSRRHQFRTFELLFSETTKLSLFGGILISLSRRVLNVPIIY